MGAAVDIFWIPLGAGAGGALVRWSGRIYEGITATFARRPRSDLYHSALAVHIDDETTTIEMAPVWTKRGDRGVVCEGAVGAPILGRSRLFRYEVRCWRQGSIPDAAAAVGGPRRVTDHPEKAQHLLAMVPRFPAATWGRDELSVGEMWNSNSLTSWLLATTGLVTGDVGPPEGGRAPGWDAGLRVASRGTVQGGQPGLR
ncbi:MAG: hypothetical protein MUE34_15035 [Acidimicrobiales bacterium]|nr:hypothetical protein [Acidimicrobiales bacterium]